MNQNLPNLRLHWVRGLLGSLWLVLLPLLGWGQLTENFETGSKASYTTATVALSSGSWTLNTALLGTLAADKKNGGQAVRMQSGGSIYTNFNKPNGAGTISLYAATYGTDATGTFVADVSTDGGTTWTAYTSPATSLTATLTQYSFAANIGGNVRVRVRMTAGTNRINIDDVSISDYSGTAATIATQDPTPTTVCANGTSTLSVPYTVTTGAPAGTYSVQLSDAVGSFTTPTTLSTTSTTSPLGVVVPTTTAGGTGYLVRVVVGTTIGSANSTPFTINGVAIAPTTDQALATSANGTTLTATETPAGASRQWYYSTTSGSGYTSAISGATGTTYTPNFATAGTYYVVAQTTFGTCTAISNEVKVTVTAPGITTGTIAAGPYCVGQSAPAAVSVPFTVSSGAFAAGNVFTAYLSSDNFVTKLAIGTLAGTGSGTIAGSIAQATGLTTSTTYRIRVEASSPTASTLANNGTDLSVASYLDNQVATASATASNGEATLTFTGPATCVTNVVVTIKQGSAFGTKPVSSGSYVPGAGSGTVAYGTGTDLGGGQYVVYNGPANGSITITVTGLTNGTQYAFGLFTTNGGAGYSDAITRTVIPVAPATLAEILVPQYLSGRPTTGSTHTTRLPYVWRASLGSLIPNTTYKYYTAARVAGDIANYGGVGVPIETQVAGAFVRKTGPSLDTNSSTFTTDANGTYTGWFGLEPTADTRFNDQSVVYPLVVLNGGDGGNTATQFLATTSPVAVVQLNTTATGATGVRGNSFGTASNFVLVYDNAAGTGRPLAGTWLESDGLASSTSTYPSFYTTSVDATAGAYGLLTPNTNANGIQRVEQRSLAAGSLVGCAATSATGTWPGGASTANPRGGTTALVLTTGDTPFTAPTLTSLSNSSIRPGQTLTLTGTGFAATPNATVTFAPGSAVAAASVNAAGTSLTVVVPSGAGAGTVAVSTSCGTSSTLATSLAPTNAPGVLLFEDDFNYAASTSLIGNGWTRIPGFSATFATTAGNLPFSTYPQGAALSSLPATTSTRASLAAGNTGPIYRSGVRPAGTSTLYAAAVVNFSNTQNTGDYFLSFLDATDTTNPNYRSRVYVTKFGNFTGTFSFQLTLSGEGRTAEATPTEFNLNTNYLVVLKTETTVVSATTSQETTSLYVLPAGADLSTEPTTPLLTKTDIVTFTGTLNSVVLRQNSSNNATLTIDGIRLATGWGAAVGNPYYAAAGATIAAGNYYSITANNADVITPTGAVNVENSLNLGSGIIASTAANPLTLYPTTSVAGGSATSYVSGPLRRVTGAGAGTTTFPIGSGANYRPLVLTATAQTGTAIYTATQSEGNAGQNLSTSNGLGTAPLVRVSAQRSYTITTSNASSGFTGTITLPFEANDYVNNPTDAGLVVAKRDAVAATSADNGKWTNLGRSASTGTGTGPGGAAIAGSLTSAPFSSFSDFTLGATNADLTSNALSPTSPLPVQLTSFAATRTASGVQVAWATASEKNSDYFVVERSLDGHAFAAVARVAAHGTTSLSHAYASLDAAAPTALLYYRLRQADLDGTVAYSPVVTVAATDGATAEFALAPNPAHESVSFLTAVPTAYTVRNTLGQLVRSGTTATGTNSLPVSELPAGVYFFELHGSAGRMVRKFVKD